MTTIVSVWSANASARPGVSGNTGPPVRRRATKRITSRSWGRNATTYASGHAVSSPSSQRRRRVIGGLLRGALDGVLHGVEGLVRRFPRLLGRLPPLLERAVELLPRRRLRE